MCFCVRTYDQNRSSATENVLPVMKPDLLFSVESRMQLILNSSGSGTECSPGIDHHLHGQPLQTTLPTSPAVCVSE